MIIFRVSTTIAVEYEGLRGSTIAQPSKRFYKGGSAPAEILLNLIAVTIPANPEALDDAKKIFGHSTCILFINYLCS